MIGNYIFGAHAVILAYDITNLQVRIQCHVFLLTDITVFTTCSIVSTPYGLSVVGVQWVY